jgi:hypothetical protein
VQNCELAKSSDLTRRNHTLEDTMKKETTTVRRRSPSNLTPAPARTGRFKLYSLMFVCLFVVVSGVFFAGRQHFSSIDYSMRNSKLRKQLEDLESEKRRLLLAREVSGSPAEIKKAAHKLGIDNGTPASVQLASANKGVKPAAPQLASAKTNSEPQPQYVVRTSYVASTTPAYPAETARNQIAKKIPSKIGSVSRGTE